MRIVTIGGKDWEFNCSPAAAKRIRAINGMDVLGRAVGEAVQLMVSDPIAVAEVAWGMVQPKAKERGITQEEFEDTLTGETFERVRGVVLDAMCDAQPGEKKRVAIREIRSKLDQALDVAFDDALATLRAIDVTGEVQAAASAE